MQCLGYKRYAIPCHNTTLNENGFCYLHQNQEAILDPIENEGERRRAIYRVVSPNA